MLTDKNVFCHPNVFWGVYVCFYHKTRVQYKYIKFIFSVSFQMQMNVNTQRIILVYKVGIDILNTLN